MGHGSGAQGVWPRHCRCCDPGREEEAVPLISFRARQEVLLLASGAACLVQGPGLGGGERLGMASVCLAPALAPVTGSPGQQGPCCAPSKGPADVCLGPWQRWARCLLLGERGQLRAARTSPHRPEAAVPTLLRTPMQAGGEDAGGEGAGGIVGGGPAWCCPLSAGEECGGEGAR